MFVYFGWVFLELLKAQISKANYPGQKHEFLPCDWLQDLRLGWFPPSDYRTLEIFTVLLGAPLSRFSPQLQSQIPGHGVQAREAQICRWS